MHLLLYRELGLLCLPGHLEQVMPCLLASDDCLRTAANQHVQFASHTMDPECYIGQAVPLPPGEAQNA